MISARKIHSFPLNICKQLIGTHIQHCFFQKRLQSLSTQPKYQCEHLTTRSLIKLTGSEVLPFLQGLVTNDIRHLENDHQTSVTLPCLYTAFLNQQGRVLYDSIVYCISDTSDCPSFLLECDSRISDNLIKHLKIYKIRKKVEILSMSNELNVWSLFPYLDSEEQLLKPLSLNLLQKEFEGKVTPTILTEDPRHAGLGCRCILPVDVDISDILSFSQKDETTIGSQYAKLRYKTGIGEGIQDHPPGKCFPLECNMDFLHGVSFHKGCYIGQELTARTHHTGVIRKRLMPVKILSEQNAEIIPESVIVNENGTNVGKFRSQEGSCGLALLRVNESLNSKQLFVKGTHTELSTVKPFWWPQESTKHG